MTATDQTLLDINTPSLVLNLPRLKSNLAKMQQRAAGLGVALRTHMKTAKSVDVARLAFQGGIGPIAVSTLKEAEYFADAGFSDIFLAAGIEPGNLGRVSDLTARAADFKVSVDSAPTALVLAQNAHEQGFKFNAVIEIDCGDNRAGVSPDSDELMDVARILKDASIPICGVFSHAGFSYGCNDIPAIKIVAETERQAAVLAATRLRDAGHTTDMVSVGSTPTAQFAENLEGITEMRPGVYTFQDMQQAGNGICSLGDIAVSVLAAVTGIHPERNTALINAGGLALSKDRSAATNTPDPGYGLVCDIEGDIIPQVYVQVANQEHGKLSTLDGSPLPYDLLQPGTRLRILPNHVCMTAAAYDCYHVVEDSTDITAVWQRINGW